MNEYAEMQMEFQWNSNLTFQPSKPLVSLRGAFFLAAASFFLDPLSA
jgi:hypothetical protein